MYLYVSADKQQLSLKSLLLFYSLVSMLSAKHFHATRGRKTLKTTSLQQLWESPNSHISDYLMP